MDEYLVQGSTLTDIADAIREKTGDSALMTPAEMVEAIAEIPSGGSDVEHHQFIHAQDWLTDATGNTAAFYNTYLFALYANKSSGFGIVVITNNTATSYKAIYSFRSFQLTNQTAWNRSSGLAPNRFDRGAANASFYISAGSQIDVYIIQV